MEEKQINCDECGELMNQGDANGDHPPKIICGVCHEAMPPIDDPTE